MTSRRILVVAALIELIAPVAAAVVVLFGGATVGNCFALVGDGMSPGPACPVQVAVWPPLRTADGIAVSLVICLLSWLAATSVLVAHVDRRRLLRLAAGIGIGVILMAAMGFAWGLKSRLLYAAQDAVTWGIAGLVLGLIVGLAWMGLRPGTNPKEPVTQPG